MFALILTLIFGTARAAPPPGVLIDPSLHAWFERQHNLRGGWCCNEADGHILEDDEWRTAGDHYEVLIGKKWHAVDRQSLRAGADDPNPTGKAIAWYVTWGEDGASVFCFAPGTMP